MSKPLPIHGFKWMSHTDSWRKKRCILEVDLDYPEHLHDLHNDYPLAPETVTMNHVNKLIPHLGSKQRYVVYCDTLKCYENKGIKSECL